MACSLSGGDDYELCFTAPPAARAALDALSLQLGLPLTRIGTMGEAGGGVTVIDERGHAITFDQSGFDHFGQ